MRVPDLFREREFWTAIIGIAIAILVEFVPDLSPSDIAAIREFALVVIGLLVGGWAVETAAAANRTGQTKKERENTEG